MRSVEAIKRKYGRDCFKKWGSPKSGGGSPVLKAWKEGRIPHKYVPKS